jgi:hypothetical protein
MEYELACNFHRDDGTPGRTRFKVLSPNVLVTEFL